MDKLERTGYSLALRTMIMKGAFEEAMLMAVRHEKDVVQFLDKSEENLVAAARRTRSPELPEEVMTYSVNNAVNDIKHCFYNIRISLGIIKESA